MFLKDAWHLDDPELRAESKTYRELKLHGVPHVPEVICGGDVRGSNRKPQETLSQIYAECEGGWRLSTHHKKYVHHHLAQEIAYPLEHALDEREYIQVLLDALYGELFGTMRHSNVLSKIIAIAGAYESAGLLHRDIGFRNIMITSDGRGILNDWDHAGTKEQLAPGIVRASLHYL